MARALLSRIVIGTVFILSAKAAEIAKLPEPYLSLAELARGATPEFTADALLRIVELGRLPDKDARQDLIEEAFRNAVAARLPVRMQGLPGTTTDTASGSMGRAYDLKLDALSLESRAVRDMLPLDPTKARMLFGQIPRPMLSALTCDDALVYDLSDFYQTLGAVVNGAFTPKERAKDDHLNFLSDYLGQATSPLELAPLAQLIETVSATAQQKQALWAKLGGLLESVQADDRSFSASLQAVNSLSAPEIQASLEKYRQRSTRCASDASSNASKKSSTPKLDAYWQSTVSRQLLASGQNLRYDRNHTPLSEADRSTPEWQQQVADFLNQLAGWTADQENSDADYYHEKGIVYAALVELVPPGPQNDKLIAEYIDFISNSNLLQQSPAEWYLEPKTLLDRVETDATMRAKILDAYQKPGNPVLSLEVALEKTFHR